MDITALSTELNRIDTNNSIGVAVLAKSLETMDTQGTALQKMMELSVNPDIGSNIDVSV